MLDPKESPSATTSGQIRAVLAAFPGARKVANVKHVPGHGVIAAHGEPMRANARRKRAQSMEDETSLMPEAVADAVTEEVEQYVGLEHGSLRPLANELADQARAIYGANADFAKKLRADSGRDTLYSFMRHWLAALLKKKRPDVFAKLPSGYG